MQKLRGIHCIPSPALRAAACGSLITLAWDLQQEGIGTFTSLHTWRVLIVRGHCDWGQEGIASVWVCTCVCNIAPALHCGIFKCWWKCDFQRLADIAQAIKLKLVYLLKYSTSIELHLRISIRFLRETAY
jgi:hypothetical protein